jgi:hypothetical protein
MAVIQFDNAPDKGFTPPPEGVYDLEILNCEQKTSQAGNPQLELQTEVASGELEGRKIRLWYSLTPQSAWKLKKLLIATHTPHEILGDEKTGTVSFDSDDLIGAIFTVDCVAGEYQGKAKADYNNERPSKLMEGPPAAAPAVATPAPAAPVQQTLAAPPAAAPAAPAAAAAPEAGFRRRSRA